MPKKPTSVYIRKQPKKLAKKTTKAVRNIVRSELRKNSELKYHYVAQPYLAVFSGTGRVLVDICAGIPQGILDNNRIGDQITMKSLHISGELVAGTGPNSHPIVNYRIMVFQYKSQDNNPAITEILIPSLANATVAVPAAASGPFSGRHVDYMTTYHVLYDKMYTTYGSNGLALLNGNSNTGQSKRFSFQVSLKYAIKKVQYEAGSLTLNTNGLYMMITTDKPTLVNDPTVKFESHLRYTDS